MTRPSFPHIGWDPTPGDVEETRSLARQIGGLASDLGTAVRELEQIEIGAWKGKAAIAFSDHISDDVKPLIKKSYESFHKASRALHRWARELQHFQDEADRLEVAAGKRLNDLADAKAKQESNGEGKEKNKKGDKKGDGKGKSVAEASSAVDDIISKVHDLETRYAHAAGLIGKELDKADDIAPNEPGVFSKIGNAFKGAVNWVKDHADVIALVGDLLSDLTAVLGLLAIVTLPFEPLGAIFGAAALVTGALALGAHSLAKLAGADVSWTKIGLDAVGLLPGIGLFSKGAKVAKTGRALTRTAKTFGTGFKGTKIASAKNLLAMGDLAKKVEGGVSLVPGRLVVLGGQVKNFGLIAREGGGVMNRLAGLSQAGYHEGQWLGTKGLKLISGGKVQLNPLGAGIALDGLGKIAPKIQSIPQHIGEAVNPGDRFQQSAN
ncbi:enoyl-CoA hydratase/isomerase family protein [Streptomyces sp. NPDC005336]|uniref:enoyl-CoA hydratase/isomerase family protein n=1 Tax=Streptomyces sp. NPDC005336 TaxID=3157035 RepID=UPI0033B2BBDD